MNLRAAKEWLKQELPDLQQAGVLDSATVQRLRDYYALGDVSRSVSIGKLILGLLGATLIGLGVVLLFAHNWELLTRPQRTVLSFLPLVSGQALVLFAHLKRPLSEPWREGSALFLLISIGACIALISQTYHLGGRLDDFLFVWFWLSLPLLYVINSSVAASAVVLLFLSWAIDIRYHNFEVVWGWIMLLAVQPFAWHQFIKAPELNRTGILQWLTIPALFLMVGHTMERSESGLWIVVYGLMLTCMYFFSVLSQSSSALVRQPAKMVSMFGMVGLSLVLTYGDVWHHSYRPEDILNSTGYLFAVLFTGLLITVVVWADKRDLIRGQHAHYPFMLFPVMIWLSYFSRSYAAMADFNTILFNLYLFVLGIMLIRHGIQKAVVSSLNYGLTILALLIAVRFFDSDIPFTVKGIVFILFGAGFLYANFVLKKRLNDAGYQEGA